MVSIALGVSSDDKTVKKVGNLRTSKYNSPIYIYIYMYIYILIRFKLNFEKPL